MNAETPQVAGEPGHEPSTLETYVSSLADYCKTRSESALYRASLWSRTCIERGLGPEEIVALHGEALLQVVSSMSFREQARVYPDALQFLLEVMIAYGVQHAEYAELLAAERARSAEARALQEQRRAEAAEQSVRANSETLAVIAHELRTPITAALGSLDLVIRAVNRGDMEPVNRLVGSAREAMARLSRLSADLVEASRGKPPELERNPVELVVALSQACGWAAAVAESKGVELVRGGGPFSARVHGDLDALLTIIGNLLSNAIRYTPPGGKVTVQHWLDADWVWVEVRDTGIGMTPEARGRMFDQFYRSPEAEQYDSAGLGLGLTLTKRLLDAHNGKIEVESEVGTGSVFRIALPLDEPSPHPQEGHHDG
jgi:signal transduction histidine kinase